MTNAQITAEASAKIDTLSARIASAEAAAGDALASGKDQGRDAARTMASLEALRRERALEQLRFDGAIRAKERAFERIPVVIEQYAERDAILIDAQEKKLNLTRSLNELYDDIRERERELAVANNALDVALARASSTMRELNEARELFPELVAKEQKNVK